MKKLEPMTHEEHLQEYLELVKHVYERMRRDNSWPWMVNNKSASNPKKSAKGGTITPNED